MCGNYNLRGPVAQAGVSQLAQAANLRQAQHRLIQGFIALSRDVQNEPCSTHVLHRHLESESSNAPPAFTNVLFPDGKFKPLLVGGPHDNQIRLC